MNRHFLSDDAAQSITDRNVRTYSDRSYLSVLLYQGKSVLSFFKWIVFFCFNLRRTEL